MRHVLNQPITLPKLLLGEGVAEASAFASLQSSLRAVQLPVPTHVGVPVTGQYQGRDLQMSVFLLPGGGAPGMLEGLCYDSTMSDPARPCVDEFLMCVGTRAGRSHAANMLPKARIRAWLSTLKEPDLLLGQAAQSGYLDFAQPAFAPLRAFIQSL